MSDTRTKQIIFHVNAHEDEMIRLKMEQTGIRNRSAYLRKMAIDGMIINLDLTEFRKMLRLMTRTAENVNQIAKWCNATGNLYEADVRELQEGYCEVRDQMKNVAAETAKLKRIVK